MPDETYPCQRIGCTEAVNPSDQDSFYVEVAGTTFHCCSWEHMDWILHHHPNLRQRLTRTLPPTEHEELRRR